MKSMFKKLSLGVASLAATTGSAFAAVPTEVSTALGDAKTDAVAVAGLALVIVIGIAAIKYMRRAV